MYEDKDEAREAIHYALNSDHCILDFSKNDSGDMVIAEITEHVEQLEEMHTNA